MDVTGVRQARAADTDDVAAFTADTWSERGVGDYIPRVFEEWVETDGPDQRTLVYETDEGVVGLCQAVLLSDYEAWAQGMRVDPAHRGKGIGLALTDALFDWAVGGGATVCRNMVFSWNVAGLGQSRAAGFDPCTEFRWAHPDPDADADPDLAVGADRAAGWAFWTDSVARDHLHGLGLSTGESWALSAVTRDRLAWADDKTALLTVVEGDARALTYRTRTYEREDDEGIERMWAEYGVGAWSDAAAARALLDGVRRDAAAVGADRTRVLIPETVEHVSDVSTARVAVSDEPDFVMAADVAGR